MSLTLSIHSLPLKCNPLFSKSMESPLQRNWQHLDSSPNLPAYESPIEHSSLRSPIPMDSSDDEVPSSLTHDSTTHLSTSCDASCPPKRRLSSFTTPLHIVCWVPYPSHISLPFSYWFHILLELKSSHAFFVVS